MLLTGRTLLYEPEACAIFRVRVSKESNSYTLIQEDITLTEEQAMRIHGAYERDNVRKEARRRLKEIMERKKEYASVDEHNYLY